VRITLLGAAAAVVLAVIFVYSSWPPPRFHVTNATIGSKRVGENVQLFANVFFNNDGGAADFTWSGATGIIRSDAPSAEQQAFVRRLETAGAKPGDAESHPPFPVGSGEGRWFTVYGPPLAPADFQRFTGGGSTFYFAATLVGRNIWQKRTALSFCAFNPGGNALDIHPCPKLP
jgi:hypothetical protein